VLGSSLYIRGTNARRKRLKLRSITSTFGDNAPERLLTPGKQGLNNKNLNKKNGNERQTSAVPVGLLEVHVELHITEEAISTLQAAGAVWAPTWGDMVASENEICDGGIHLRSLK